MQLLDLVLKSLGKRGQQTALCKALEQHGQDISEVRRPVDRPYPVAFDDVGLTLIMHYLPGDEASHVPPQWGLQSIHLENKSWESRWLQGQDCEALQSQAVTDLLARKKTETMVTPEVACFMTDGDDETKWSMVAMFNAGGKGMKSLTVTRMDEWVDLADHEELAA